MGAKTFDHDEDPDHEGNTGKGHLNDGTSSMGLLQLGTISVCIDLIALIKGEVRTIVHRKFTQRGQFSVHMLAVGRQSQSGRGKGKRNQMPTTMARSKTKKSPQRRYGTTQT